MPFDLKKYRKEYYLANKERLLVKQSVWHLENSERRREYKLANRKKINAQYRKRREVNSTARLTHQIRNRILSVLKGTYKSARTIELLGCSFSEARIHLETKFLSGMTWKNHGLVWHVDHIRPCASFDLTDPVQQRECFHYKNLQPLFALDNLKKGKKYDGLLQH